MTSNTDLPFRPASNASPSRSPWAFPHPGKPTGASAHFSLIVKPTHACNLCCQYCYVPIGAEHGVMPLMALHNVMAQAGEFAKTRRVTLIWHGGEPLLVGLDFYREVARLTCALRAVGGQIANCIQTNGTLITDELLDFVVSSRDFGFDHAFTAESVQRPEQDEVESTLGSIPE